MSSYRDRVGIDNRANSALLRLERILEDRSVPSAVRLVQAAQVLKDEPILTDDCPAAFVVRSEAAIRQDSTDTETNPSGGGDRG